MHNTTNTKPAVCTGRHICQAAKCMSERRLPCNYRLAQYVCCPLLLRLPHTLLHVFPKPLTHWLLCNDHWNGSFCLIDTAWTLWHVGSGDYSSKSNDCRCGSQFQLMTFAMGWGKCLSPLLPVLLCPFICQKKLVYSEWPTDSSRNGNYEGINWFIHPYMKK